MDHNNSNASSSTKTEEIIKEQAAAQEKSCCSNDNATPSAPACCCTRHTDRSEADRKKLINRLKRIEGQIRGIIGMLENDAYCNDILIQSAAVNAAGRYSDILPPMSGALPHKAVDGIVQRLDGLLVTSLHRIHDAVADVILENGAARAVQRGDHRAELHQHLGAVLAALHHLPHGIQMALGPAEPVQHGFGLGMGMVVAVAVLIDPAVLVHMGMGMFAQGYRLTC